MEDYLVVEAKQEYTTYLIGVLTPTICSGFRGIFEQAKKINNGNSVFKNFQLLLANVPGWNNYMLEKEVADIIKETGCSWLDDLLTAVFVSHSKILASVKVGNYRPRNKKIDLKIPETAHFVHLCYIHAAREFYKNPMLFIDDPKVVRPDEILKNHQVIQTMVKAAICDTIRKLLPFKDIVNQYLAMDNNSPLYIGGAPAPVPVSAPVPAPVSAPVSAPAPVPLLSLTQNHNQNHNQQKKTEEKEEKYKDHNDGDDNDGDSENDHDDDDDNEQYEDEKKRNLGGGEKSEKSRGKVLDLYSAEFEQEEEEEEKEEKQLPPQQQPQQQQPPPPPPPAKRPQAQDKYESIDSMTVQNVVSKIQNEFADKKEKEKEKETEKEKDSFSFSVGMTELQGVLQDGGTIQGFNNNNASTRTFLPQKKQQNSKNSNHSNNKKKGTNNIKKIVVKYSGGEVPLGGKGKKKVPLAAATTPTPTTLIDDAADVDSSEYRERW